MSGQKVEKRISLKRIGLALVLLMSIVLMIGCGGGNGGSKQVTISISPEDVTLYVGEKQQFTAVVTGLSDQRVSWSATGGEIDENGLYLATTPGTFEVIATSKADPSKTAKAKVFAISEVSFEDYSEIEAWQGYITCKVNASWSSTGETGTVYQHQYNDDIKREYRLEEKGYYWWRRLPQSPVEVSGSIHERSEGHEGDYCEVKWQGQLTVVPDVLFSERDYLKIDEEAGTYTIVLYGFKVPGIKMVLYEDNDPVESWDGYGLETIEIADQPLPSVGMTLTGSKVEKVSLAPLWYETGAYVEKEADMTITWHFTPME